MSKHLQRDMDNLQRDLLALATLVEEAIHNSIQALQRGDAELAQQVIAGDSEIDQKENQVTEDCLKILALHQPVAGDLRRIAVAMMISTDLERMGDLAEEIVERSVILARHPQLAIPEKLQRMTDLTTLMVRQALDCFVHLDPRSAQPRRRGGPLQRNDHPGVDPHHAGVARAGRAGAVAVLGDTAPGADRRPRDQHRRGRDLPGRGRGRPPPAGVEKGRRTMNGEAGMAVSPATATFHTARARMRILIIEDERAMTEVLSYNLQREGYEVLVAHDGQEGLRKAQMQLPDLIILDLMLPTIDGLEVCRQLRAGERTKHIPILMLTAKAEETDQVIGFSMGADDYVTKPFSIKVLQQRIKALQRRRESAVEAGDVVEHQGVKIDRTRHRAYVQDRELDLTPTEFKLLE